MYIALALVSSLRFLRSRQDLFSPICSRLYATLRDKAAAPELSALRCCPQRRAVGVEVGHNVLQGQRQ